MGGPSKNRILSASSNAFRCTLQGSTGRQAERDRQRHDTFPHDYIRASGYSLPPDEEQTICTVYQKTPPEHRERLRDSLKDYIEWRCSTSDREYHHSDTRNGPDSLHLCTHINRDLRHEVDKNALSAFADTLENDGIIRLDLLWNMKSYRKWFDATSPGVLAEEIPA